MTYDDEPADTVIERMARFFQERSAHGSVTEDELRTEFTPAQIAAYVETARARALQRVAGSL